ncbi:MAG: glycine dehydrogenase (aminomethyl-transferring) [Candidatus Rokubacteria bacterium 13_1_40CM_69_27]|nr:MAG: glycine dehydrogenase (aminomethyl-transferring) [Candidatus Rokubacteria bacterium 13_1_40CM_69_27]OLC31466.1 MAG: glycine dehydrogenase (aminomethyl-transferring) [Candidatus Rokubacteria bacterium 13_1_40CM_4_69_5]
MPYDNAKTYDKLIFELSSPGRVGYSLPAPDVPVEPARAQVPAAYLRREPVELPEVSELDVVRHYSRLSQMNYGLDTHFYPLGSCTMKYNPKINEDMARLAGFGRLHPLAPDALAQGALRLMHELAGMLAEISGMDTVSLQPAAGAQGELAGVLMIKAYHEANREKRTKVLVPDSAHGTNPASTAVAGYEVIEVKSDANGEVDLGDLARHLGPDVAAFMITVPNTLGNFEPRIVEIIEMCHARGVQVYMDGANLNAVLGITRPGDLGFDVCHFNLHKTFTTPHGGGGPGAGPVGIKAHLEPFLPAPVVVKDGDRYALDWKRPKSIGKLQAFWGNFGMHVRAYTYIRTMGPDGLRAVSENAVLNANYIMKRLESHFDVAAPGPCMHECVLSARRQKRLGVTAMDIAKRLLDLGFYAPSTYFPLIVEEALMIEPTETESKETLDAFCDAMIQIAKEAETNPEVIRSAPVTTPVRRLDQTRAAREPNLRWRPGA